MTYLMESTFLGHLLAAGLSNKTAIIYNRMADRAVSWFIVHGARLEEASAVDLAAWVQELPFSASTRRQARSALREYFLWVGRMNPPLKAIPVPVKPRYLCRALSEPDAARLVAASVGWHPRGTAVLAGLYLALRAAEIAAMRWDKFDPDFNYYKVMGKGAYEATLPVHPKLKAQLLTERHGYVYVFPGSKGIAHATPATIWLWVKQVAAAAGLTVDVQTHQLRHTALAHAHDRTGNLRAVSEFARHRRLETTMLYTRTTAAALQQVVNALDY